MKLLFILLLGLGFTQTIQTKQIEIYIDEISDYEVFPDGGYDHRYGLNISDYINLGLNDGNYIIELSNVTSNTPIDNSFGFRGCNESWSVPNKFTNDYNSPISSLPAIPGNMEISHTSFISYDCPYIFIEQNLTGSDNLSANPMTLVFWVTGVFENEDTGYIEEGYQFCVQPGANLLSFPCDNPISVNQSLPQGAENFITQIVGQGVATSYNPALGWVGSLDNFSPGSGYWFKSNESLCFEYDCVED